MTLNNKNLIEISKFAIKAKKHIGVVKAVKMFHDQQYASDILVKATLSDNNDLIELTKKISGELNMGVALISSVESYINFLKAKNASEDCINDGKYYLIKLTHYLHGVAVNGVSFRHAVDLLVKNLGEADRAFCIKLAREYYPFWNMTSSLVTELSQEQDAGFSEQKEVLMEIWDGIDGAFLSNEENWSLLQYAEHIKKMGLTESEVNTRKKIAKLIIVGYRKSMSKFAENYRNIINSIQGLFSSQEMKAFFLHVSREYYQFWVVNISEAKAA